MFSSSRDSRSCWSRTACSRRARPAASSRSPRLSSVSAEPRMPVSGVRNSWLTVAMRSRRIRSVSSSRSRTLDCPSHSARARFSSPALACSLACQKSTSTSGLGQDEAGVDDDQRDRPCPGRVDRVRVEHPDDAVLQGHEADGGRQHAPVLVERDQGDGDEEVEVQLRCGRRTGAPAAPSRSAGPAWPRARRSAGSPARARGRRTARRRPPRARRGRSPRRPARPAARAPAGARRGSGRPRGGATRSPARPAPARTAGDRRGRRRGDGARSRGQRAPGRVGTPWPDGTIRARSPERGAPADRPATRTDGRSCRPTV